MHLPSEIMVNVFSWLDLRSLDAAGLVCKRWYRIISDDSVWRAAFLNTHGGQGSFSRLTSSVSWKQEFVERNAALRRWKKASGSRNISFKVPLNDLTRVAVDFAGMRIISFSLMLERGLAVDLNNGRVAYPFIKTSLLGGENLDISGIPDVSKFGMVFPFSNGLVTTVAFSRGVSVRDFKRFPGAHGHTPVTCAWASQTVSPRTAGSITCVTGDASGTVKAWAFLTGEELFSFKLPTWEEEPGSSDSGPREQLPFGDMVPVVYLESDSENYIVVCDNGGRVFHYDRRLATCTFVAHTGSVGDMEMHLRNGRIAVDFVGGYILVHRLNHIVRYSIGQTTLASRTVNLVTGSTGFDSQLGPFSLDESLYTGMATSTTPGLLPGHGARYLACFSHENKTYVWDMRQAVDNHANDGKVLDIKPMYSVESPFLNQFDVTSVALNSAVLAICASNANVMIHNVLTGKRIRLATSRFPKKILDYNTMGDSPAFQIMLDSDATKCHGVVVVSNAVQYFSYGIDAPAHSKRSKGVRKRILGHRASAAPPGPRNEELLKEMDDEYEIAKEVIMQEQREERSRQSSTPQRGSETAFLDDMTEEEQLKYALMISQDHGSSSGSSNTNLATEPAAVEEDDEELKAAIQMSLLESGANSGSNSKERSLEASDYYSEDDYDDDDLYEPSPASRRESSGGRGDGQSSAEDVDEDLALALRLSLQQQ